MNIAGLFVQQIIYVEENMVQQVLKFQALKSGSKSESQQD